MTRDFEEEVLASLQRIARALEKSAEIAPKIEAFIRDANARMNALHERQREIDERQRAIDDALSRTVQ